MSRSIQLAVALGLVCVVTAWAQQNAQQQGAKNHDSDFAYCLLWDNQNEVKVAEFAKQHADSKDVKEFAQMMIDDHTDFMKDLQKFVDKGQVDQETAFWRTIKKDMSEECFTMASKELEGKEGAKFDECFIGMQLAGHMHMLTQLKVYEKHSTGEFKRVLGDAIETTQDHLDQAKDLIKNTSAAAAETARREKNDKSEKK